MANETPDTPDGDLIFIDPVSGLEIRELSPALDDSAATIAADHPDYGSADVAAHAIAGIRATPTSALYGGSIGGELVAVFGLQRDGMANDLPLIVVRRDHRRRGIGRVLLQDALRRSGKRPLVAQTDPEILAFFRACGFKMVGRRVRPDGELRFRVGWHAPGAHFKGGTTSALEHRPLDGQGES